MNNKKIIAFYIGSLGIGGAERVITNLASFFNATGYKVYMVTKLIEDHEYPLDDGVERIVADLTGDELTGSRVRNLIRRIRKLANIWRDIKPDIIVSFIRKNNLMALASTVGMHLPVVVCIRSAPERELAGKIMLPLSKLMFRRAAGIVVQTNRGKAFFSGKLQHKIVVMPNSINPAFIEQGMRRAERDYVPHNQIVTCGRIDDNKNQKMLIDAFSRIADRYDSWTLHIYGDGEKRSKLEQYVYDVGLADQVKFYGRVDNVEKYLMEADIFVLPSRVEGMPNALIEAMAMGVACISTDCPCGGPADLITDGQNGYLVSVDDVKELADRLENLIVDEGTRITLMNQAYHISQKLNPNIVNAQWRDYIERIINEY